MKEEGIRQMAQVLIIDDDPAICPLFSTLLEEMGHKCKIANTLKHGRMLSMAENFDLVLLDMKLPDGNGLDLMPELAESPGRPEVIIITGTGDLGGAELAFKYGAWDYVQKPFLLDEVTLPITRALQYRSEKQTNTQPVPLNRSEIIGESGSIRKCLEEVAKASSTDVSVLITGETGTGKEIFARAIHDNSKRSGHPFVAIDCGALPDTLVENTLFGHEKGAFTGAGNKQDGLLVQARGGTVLLDEVGDLPLETQKSFLRTLQERCVRPIGGKKEIPVNIRLIAATNLDLDSMVKEKKFREDLLYRIRAMEIKLPPLRERGEDIEAITIRKLHTLSRQYQMEPKAVSSEFIQTLSAHDWPGNVRELINTLEYALASAGTDPTLFPKHLPSKFRMSGLKFQGDLPVSSPGIPDSGGKLPLFTVFRNQMEKKYLKALIQKAGGDRKAACRISGISQSRLYGLLRKHGLSGFGRS